MMNGTGVFARPRRRGAGLWPVVLPASALLGVAAVATSQSRQLERIAEIGTVLLAVAVALFTVTIGLIVLVARFRAARRDDQQLAPVPALPPRGMTNAAEQIEEEAA
ncbi:hypothetical protein [Pseudonocardia sp. ICBG1142]|uniref:hypothetical protein n=1 Tax=Pseudonocardia sp. ICBG1142 TaxID=2846760 RepID=UPI001CF6D035|nr:hypothetical protein [Pseudonocardia sp. ICBG1142]